MSNEPSQLRSMVKRGYSGRRGYNPMLNKKFKKCVHEHDALLIEKSFTQFTPKSS